MSNRARNPRPTAPKSAFITRKLMFAAAFVMVSALATLAAFGPQAISLQRLLTPFVGASVAPQQSFKEVDHELHADPPAAFTAPSGSMAVARSGHTATVLADGKVLIVGGSGDTSAEVYDPVSGTAAAAGNTTYSRTGHTATRLSDGRVLIAGGANTLAEIYDPAAGTFELGPEMTASRSGHTATAVGSTVVITGGGSNGVEVFNGTGFTAAGTLTESRTNHSAVAMNDGRVFIAGGTGSATAEIYNPADGTSAATGNPLAHARAKAHLRVLHDGKVQIIGGNDDVSMEVYDPLIDTVGAHVHLLPDTDTCTGLRTGVRDSQTRAALFFAGNADSAHDRTGHTITEISGNRALVIGGTSSSGASNTVTDFASSPATITTDKLDYAPGETVNFSGTGFAPGETVRVVIHEDPHTHTERNFEAVADSSGNISGNYEVESHDLGVNFIVNARGLSSNVTAQTAFTDGSVRVRTNGPTVTVATFLHQNQTNCNGASVSDGSVTINTSFTNKGVPNPHSYRVVAPLSVGANVFAGWTSPDASAFTDLGNGGICIPSSSTNNREFQANYVAAAPTSLQFVQQPSNSLVGATIAPAVTVRVVDQVGNPISSTAPITLAIGTNPSSGILGGTLTVNAVGGVATFNNLSINNAGNGYTLAAASAGLAGTTSNAFNITKANTSTTVTSDHLNPLAWSQIFPTGAGPSTATCAQSTVDDGNGRLIVYARQVCGGGAGEVWVQNNANGVGTPAWTLVSNSGPSRHAQTVEYDPTTNRLMLFGGCSGGCTPVNNDVWVLTNANGQGGPAVWTQLAPSGAPPAPRNHAAGAYDPVSNRLMIFGGQNGAGTVAGNTFADVWVLSNANGTGGTPAWTQLSTTGAFPLGQHQSRTFYDSANNRLTVAGGSRSTDGVASSAVNVLTNANGLGGTPNWTNLIVEGAPGAPAFSGWNVDYDAAGNRGILSQASTNNLYYLNNANGLGGPTLYTQVMPSGGPGAGFFTIGVGHDPSTGRVLGAFQNGSVNSSYFVAPASSSAYGDLVTFTATVSVNAPGAGTPTGNVEFFDGAISLGVVPVSGSTAQISTSALTAGVHNITAQYLGDTNFNTSTSGILPHTVTKKTLTVTADDQTITYGDPDPSPFTFQYSNDFVSPDNAGDIDTPPTCSVAGPHSDAGSYPITCSGGSDADYDFTYVAGTLTIDQRTLVVTASSHTVTYGDPAPTITPIYDGFVNGDDEDDLTTQPTCSTIYEVGMNVADGPFASICADGVSGNYEFEYVIGLVTVEKADTTTTITCPASVTYNGSAQTPCTALVTGPNSLNQSVTVSHTNNTNAGTANASAIYPGDGNYNGSSDAETFQIDQAQVTATAGSGSGTYNGLTQSPSACVLGGAYTGSLTCANNPSSVGPGIGTTTIVPITSGPDLANFAVTTVNGSYTISPALVMATAGSGSGDYNGSTQSPSACQLSGSYLGGLSCVNDPASVGPNVGTFPIQPVTSGADIANFIVTPVNGSYTINALTVTVTPTAGQSKVYGVTPDPTLTYGFTPALIGTDSFSGTLARDSGEDVGLYNITQGNLTLSPNYTLTFVTGIKFQITKAELTVTADDQSRGYGDPNPTSLTYEITGFVSGDGLGDITGEADCTTTAIATTPVADSPVDIVCTEGNLAADNYSFTFAPGELEITAATLSINANPGTKVYGNADPTFTYELVGYKNGEDFTTAGVAGLAECLRTPTDEDVLGGPYSISCGDGTLTAANYVFATGNPAAFTITQRPITVTADAKTKVYGDADPALTYLITTGSLAFSDAFTGSLTRVSGENVGSYAIQQGTLDLGPNYYLTYVGANLSITPRPVTVTADPQTKVYGEADPTLSYQITSGTLFPGDAFSGALARAAGANVGTYAINQGTLTLGTNYNLSFVGANFVITTRPVTVTADPQTKVYGETDPALSYQVTSGTLVTGDSFTGALDRAAGENVGTYAITQGTLMLSTNYDLSYVGANLTITARPIEVTADNKTKVYGDGDPTLTYQITSGSLAFSDAFTGTLARAAGENVNTYVISQGTLALSANYDLTFVEGAFEITARPIEVTADNKTKVYGEADPALTYTISDGSLVFSDVFTGELSRAAGEDVDTYVISQGTLALNANYSLSFVAGVFEITALEVTVTPDAGQSKVYGSTDPTLTYQFAPALVGSDTFSGALVRDPGENVGLFNITQGTLALSSNYTLTFVSGVQFEITPATLTVTASSHTVTFGDAAPAVTPIYSGFVAGDDENDLTTQPTCSTTYTQGSTVSPPTYPTNCSGGLAQNYNFSYVPGAVTVVNVAPSGVTVGSYSVSENGTVTVNVSFTDPDPNQTHTITINWGEGGPDIFTVPVGSRTFTRQHQYLDDNPTATLSDVYAVAVTVFDGAAADSGNGSVTVNNVNPVITTITGQVAPVAIGTSVNVTAAFTDVGTQDTHSCLVNWDDGAGLTAGGTVSQGVGGGSCSASKSFAAPGVYTVTVRITDDDTGYDEEEYSSLIVVYDPNAGFVTGGGFIDSPAGASSEFPTAVGKANFGFVSKYKKGSNTPEGQTEFQFKAGNLNFHSSAYDAGSLVISSFKAQYKGTGTVNGQAGYRFVLTAYDGQINGGGGTDKFRMKIIRISDDEVVYDNARGSSDDIDAANPVVISGGSIVIHKGK